VSAFGPLMLARSAARILIKRAPQTNRPARAKKKLRNQNTLRAALEICLRFCSSSLARSPSLLVLPSADFLCRDFRLHCDRRERRSFRATTTSTTCDSFTSHFCGERQEAVKALHSWIVICGLSQVNRTFDSLGDRKLSLIARFTTSRHLV
jgi:hypothetical protein